eukprot:TRINITY_DN11091_c0_g1_i2.p1 TRINITY_DN11091_c0_g1~~TRINITY_DN11091_c0_g1_i2.p1  ORF type:complete len:351 (+),score=140.37 TRINITY_DN11091_c0_g1_i2:453-1505(+)
MNDSSAMKLRKPFSGSPIGGASRLHEREEEEYFKKKISKKLEESEASERFAVEKKELLERVRAVEERYTEMEGARALSRCFATAVRSIEELIDSKNAQYNSARLVSLLHNNLRNFLESTEKGVRSLKAEISRSGEDVMMLKASHEAEKKEWEDQLKQEQAKFQSKTLVQNFNALKEKYNQMRINSEREKKEMASHISLLTMNNKVLLDKLKKLEEDTNVVNTAQTINKLTTDLQQTKEFLKDETEDKSNMGFKLHTMLEATKSELKEKDESLEVIIRKYNDLLKDYKGMVKELEEYRRVVRKNEENMMMTREDNLQIKFRAAELENLLQEKDKVTAVSYTHLTLPTICSV